MVKPWSRSVTVPSTRPSIVISSELLKSPLKTTDFPTHATVRRSSSRSSGRPAVAGSGVCGSRVPSVFSDGACLGETSCFHICDSDQGGSWPHGDASIFPSPCRRFRPNPSLRKPCALVDTSRPAVRTRLLTVTCSKATSCFTAVGKHDAIGRLHRGLRYARASGVATGSRHDVKKRPVRWLARTIGYSCTQRRPTRPKSHSTSLRFQSNRDHPSGRPDASHAAHLCNWK